MDAYKLWKIYCDEMPEFIEKLAGTQAMQRLKYVGMSCGCEYVALHRRGMDQSHRYTRFEHSVGVALIVWNFTHDVKQSVAGLFHDISTPAFAHAVDYMNGDHVTQESTEALTSDFIDGSEEIQRILKELGLTTQDVCDYHLYPIADNDSPQLSADRMEYTFGTFLRCFIDDVSNIIKYYNNIVVGTNGQGDQELVFKDREIAEKFALCSMKCSYVYTEDSGRFTVQFLADLLRSAAEKGIISVDDLYNTEEFVIDKLCHDEWGAEKWRRYTDIKRVNVTSEPIDGKYCVRVNTKRRYIDPYVMNYGRVTEFSEKYREAVDELMNRSFDCWLSIG